MTGPKPLSVLEEVTSGSDADIFYMVRDNTDHRITYANLLKAVAAISHSHTIANVTGLQDQLTTLTTSTGTATTNIASLQSQMAGKAATSHTHTIGQVSGLDSALADKAAAVHTHTMAQVQGLDTALSGKAPTSHEHTTAQIQGLDAALAARALSVHSHSAGQITDFAESVDDRVAVLLNTPVGSGIVKNYDDPANLLNLRVDIDSLTEDVAPDAANDFVMVHKGTAGSIRKMKLNRLPGGTGGTGTSYTLPVASSTVLGGVKTGAGLAIAADGTLSVVGGTGGGTQGQIRVVTVESFAGTLGANQTDAIRRANLSAFNDALTYCRNNQYGLFVTPGVWEIAGGHIRQDNRGGAVHVFGYRSVIRQFTTGESIWEITGEGGTFSDITLEYNAQQTTGDAVTNTGTLKSTFTIVNGGSGYTSAPTVTITPDPRDASGFNATATATVSGGAVTAITLGNPGVRYTYPPLVSFSGGGGGGASATAQVNMPHAALRLLGAVKNDIRHIRIRRAWVGLLSTPSSPSHSNRLDHIDIGRPGLRGVSFNGGSGNEWGSIYVHGDGITHACDGGVYLFGQGQSSFDLIHIEGLACRYPLEIGASEFGTISALRFVNIRPLFLSDPPKYAVMSFIKSGSQGIINSATVSGTDLQGTDSVNRPTRCMIFAHQQGSRVVVNDLWVTNTLNKNAATTLALLGPSGTSASDNRGVGYEFRQVNLDRTTTTPHLIDRLSFHVPDTPNSYLSGVLRYNQGLGGNKGFSAPWGDADVTIYSDIHGQYQEFTIPLTAARTVTVSNRLDAPYVNDTVQSPLLCRGFRQRIVRASTATGAFPLIARREDGTTLGSLNTAGDWMDLFFNGTAMVVEDASIQVTGSPTTVLGFDAAGNAAAVPNLRSIVLPVTAETGAVTAGANQFKMHAPFPMKITTGAAGVNSGSTTGAITVDVKAGGTSLFGATKISIAQSTEYSGAGGAPTMAVTDIAAGTAITVDVTAPGSGATGLKVYLIGYLV